MRGKVIKYGDNVSTDAIIAGKYTKTLKVQDLADHAMEDLDPDFHEKVKTRRIIAAGTYFGCGSSREQAPTALKAAGIECILAKEFARIFYRNAINIGLPIMECPEAAEAIQAGDTVSVDFASGVITDETQGKTWQAAPFPEFVNRIIEAGGLLNSLKARGVAK